MLLYIKRLTLVPCFIYCLLIKILKMHMSIKLLSHIYVENRETWVWNVFSDVIFKTTRLNRFPVLNQNTRNSAHFCSRPSKSRWHGPIRDHHHHLVLKFNAAESVDLQLPRKRHVSTNQRACHTRKNNF